MGDSKLSKGSPSSSTLVKASDSTDLKFLAEDVKRPKKALGPIDGTCFTVGIVIGCGIFISINYSYAAFKCAIGLVVLIFLFVGILCMLGVLCYIELATRIPESGGEAVYFKKLINQEFSRLFVIFFVFVIKSLQVAALALTSAKNIVSTFATEENPYLWCEQLLAILSVLLGLLINCISKKIAVKVTSLLTVLKITAILIISGAGFYYIGIGQAPEWKTPFDVSETSFELISGAIVGSLWAFDGGNSIIYAAGDVQNPSRDLPYSIFLGFPVVIILYILAVISYSSILGYDEAKNAKAIAVLSAQKFMGSASPIMAVLVCCSATGALIALLFAQSCICTSAGRSGDLPRIFSLVHKRTRIPIISLCLIATISCIFTFISFDTILSCCTFLLWIFYFVTYLCLWKIKLQTRKQKLPGVFQVPFALIVPVQLACFYVIVTCFLQQKLGCSLLFGIFIFLLLIQYIPSRYLTFLDKLSIPEPLYQRFCSLFNFEQAIESDVS